MVQLLYFEVKKYFLFNNYPGKFPSRLYLQNICILLIGVLNILNNFLPASYLELSIKLADKWKFPVLVAIALALHGGLSIYCQAQRKCIELIAKHLTFITFIFAVIMKGIVIIDTLLRGDFNYTLNLFSHFISFLITSDNCFIAKLGKVFQKNQWNRSKLEKNCILEM